MKRQLTVVVVMLVAVTVALIVWHRRTAQNPAPSVTPLENGTRGETVESNDAPAQAQSTTNATEHGQVSLLTESADAAKYFAAQQKWAKKNNGPVTFHAKVVDQNDEPVAGVVLNAALNIFDEGILVNDKERVHTAKVQLLSDSAGHFDLKRDRGSTLRVESLEKEGYVWLVPRGLGTFDFSVIRQPRQPADYKDPDKRTVFHVWKKGPTEPITRQGVRIRLLAEQEEYGVNLLTGQKVAINDAPDLIIRIPLVSDADGAARGHRLITLNVPNGGILETADAYPYSAPAEGYQRSWQWVFRAADTPPGAEEWKRNFYVRARDGRLYAGLSVRFDSMPAFEIDVIANTGGSRVLEPDPAKQITDPEEIRRLDESTRSK